MKIKLLWLVPPLMFLAFFLFFFSDSAPEHIFLITLDTMDTSKSLGYL